MSEARIIYTPSADATPEGEASAFAAVYRFLLNRRAKGNAAGVPSTNGDDATKGFWISEKEKGGRHVEI
jgi:hypothetical protein